MGWKTEVKLSELAIDTDLRGAPLSVLLFLSDNLSRTTAEPVKIAYLTKVLKYNKATASRALATLTDRGYLVPGDPDGKIRTYRFAVSISIAIDLPKKRSRRRAPGGKGFVGRW